MTAAMRPEPSATACMRRCVPARVLGRGLQEGERGIGAEGHEVDDQGQHDRRRPRLRHHDAQAGNRHEARPWRRSSARSGRGRKSCARRSSRNGRAAMPTQLTTPTHGSPVRPSRPVSVAEQEDDRDGAEEQERVQRHQRAQPRQPHAGDGEQHQVDQLADGAEEFLGRHRLPPAASWAWRVLRPLGGRAYRTRGLAAHDCAVRRQGSDVDGESRPRHDDGPGEGASGSGHGIGLIGPWHEVGQDQAPRTGRCGLATDVGRRWKARRRSPPGRSRRTRPPPAAVGRIGQFDQLLRRAAVAGVDQRTPAGVDPEPEVRPRVGEQRGPHLERARGQLAARLRARGSHTSRPRPPVDRAPGRHRARRPARRPAAVAGRPRPMPGARRRGFRSAQWSGCAMAHEHRIEAGRIIGRERHRHAVAGVDQDGEAIGLRGGIRCTVRRAPDTRHCPRSRSVSSAEG